MTTDRDLTLAEAADQLGISRDALRKRCDRGLVDGAFKADGRWLIPAVSLAGHADRPTGRDFLTVRPVSHSQDLTGQAVTAAIAALVAQLVEKDRQIAEKDRQIAALLDQARGGQPVLVSGQPASPADLLSQNIVSAPAPAVADDTPPRRPWWRRLLGR